MRWVCVLLTVCAAGATAFGQISADSVVAYTEGSGVDTGYNNPNAALGLPQSDTGYGILTPFNAAYSADQLVGIGAGGSLELHLSAPVPVGPGATLGVHAGIGLSDYDYPDGQAGDGSTSEPLLYTNPRQADVSVSPDGVNWESLGLVTFDNPTNYYSQGVTTPSEQFTPGTAVADFAQPFTASLTDFESQDWSQILTLLDGSAGGTWLDLSGTGFSSVSYVEFSVPDGAQYPMYLESVVGVPEPAAGALLAAALVILTARRRDLTI